MTEYNKLWVAREGGSFDIDGQPVILNPGDVVEEGHPVLNGRQQMFRPFEVRFAVTKPAPAAKAKDDEDDEDEPSARARTPRTR